MSPKSRPNSNARKRKLKQESDSESPYVSSQEFECDETLPGPSSACDSSKTVNEILHSNLQEAINGACQLQTGQEDQKPVKVKELKNTLSLVHFQQNNTNAFVPYYPGRWTPQMYYRMPQDVIMDTIRKHGSEGVGRAEIGQTLGMDSTVKAGGRRVTNYIATCTTEHSDHIGQFQKMDGKIRTIRFFWKECQDPDRFDQLLKEFKELSGIECPFKIGAVIKFPDQKLNTLRISDVSLKRLNRILKIAEDERVIVTMNKMIKIMTEEEYKDGYKYQIDKKSMLKCMLALKKHNLLQVWETTVRSENIDYQIQIVAHRDILQVSDAEVERAIQSILDSYYREGRVFPHGQLRTFAKPKIEQPRNEFDEALGEIDEDMKRERSIRERYHFHRLQVLRNSWKGHLKKKAESDDEDVVVEDDEDIEEEEDQKENDVEVDDRMAPEITPMEGGEEDALNGNASILVLSTHALVRRRSNVYYFGRETLGYQSKAIRLYVTHEFAFYFVYGHPEGTAPHVFNIFPPTQAYTKWPILDEMSAHVFVDEESPYRYMPPQPKYEGSPRGWFMIQDFMAAMPLSVLVMIAHIPKTIDRKTLLQFLTDPLKRHLCVGYLPKDVREKIFKEKKISKQIENLLLLLAAMGLGAVGPNPSFKRFPSAISTMYYVGKKATLKDTSTSQRSYSLVTQPMSIYKTYEYELETIEDLTFYWHHLRAIVQSTPLSFRMEEGIEPQNINRHKQYSMGTFDKKKVERGNLVEIDELRPLEPCEGVAGYDGALYLHLKRHWDLITIPHNVVNWFISKFRKNADDLRDKIEKKVESIQKDWNSFVRSMMPTDIELTKSKKHSSSLTGDFVCPPPKQHFNPPKKYVTKSVVKKKRKPDNVDLVCSSSRVNVRCRFSSKERDMLIMIRAVGFFLNPVYRFWLDPTVLRDLMHEFVPEARSKTVQSLMACGVRELVRSNRLSYLQRIVRSLSTFPEMRVLRFKLCSSDNATPAAKTEFFKEAFRKAMRLLFIDNSRVPHTSASDRVFLEFLEKGNVSVTKEETVSNPLPIRSQKALTYSHISHCVATNILLSVLIHATDGQFSESVLDQVSPAVLQSVLQSLRTDGLVSRTRQTDTQFESVTKNQASLSYYFRHFFAHRFHHELIDGSGLIFDQVNEETNGEMLELTGDAPSYVVAAAASFTGLNYNLEMTVDSDILDAYARSEEDQTTKKIRYLESANLHFEKVHVYLERSSQNAESHDMISQVLLNHLNTSKAILEETVDFDDWVQEFDVKKRKELRKIMPVIRRSKVAGVTLKELANTVNIPIDILQIYLDEMDQAQQILKCGVDETRWVSIEHEEVWTIRIGDLKWCPRPWLLPIGGICLPTVRWMSESILLTIVGKLGILLKDLMFLYEFAIQPIAVRELVDLLEKAGCIEIIEKEFDSPRLCSPFSAPSEVVSVTYLVPTVNAVERFSTYFHGIQLLGTMVSKSFEDRR